MTIALTLTANKILSFGMLIKNMDIIETLGAVSIICTDMQGILT
jgi:magnesium-transporting ATPase (P-type)